VEPFVVMIKVFGERTATGLDLRIGGAFQRIDLKGEQGRCEDLLQVAQQVIGLFPSAATVFG